MRRAGTSGIGAQEWGHECDKESGSRKGRSSTRFNQMPPALAILATELFASKGIGAFRFSAALIEWSKSELDSLQKIWVQAYKNAWQMAWSTANSLYTFPTAEAGHECSLPLGVLVQALLQHADQCMRHEDVSKKIMLAQLARTLDEWHCVSFTDLIEEMDLWEWNDANKDFWSRLAKALQMTKVSVTWAEEFDKRLAAAQDTGRISWATATRSMRLCRRRIEKIGGSRVDTESRAWGLDTHVWNSLWTGEEAMRKGVPLLRKAGYRSVEDLPRTKVSFGSGAYQQLPPVLRMSETSNGEQRIRILVPQVTGLSNKTRLHMQEYLNLGDWRGLELPSNDKRRKESVKLFELSTSVWTNWANLKETLAGLQTAGDEEGQEDNSSTAAKRKRQPDASPIEFH